MFLFALMENLYRLLAACNFMPTIGIAVLK